MFLLKTKKSYIAVILLINICSFLMAYDPPTNNRIEYNFNIGWKFSESNPSNAQSTSFNDSGWETVSTPHTFVEDYAFKNGFDDEPFFSGSIAWYRKHFTLPSNLSGRRIFIEFEGARQAAEVYINGTWIGRYENGVSAFGFEITDNINFGSTENIIAVKIDSSRLYKEVATGSTFQWHSSDQWGQTFGFNPNYGGIPRNVFLHVTDPSYQTFPLYSSMGTIGTYVYANLFDISQGSAAINVECQVQNSYSNSRSLAIQVDLVDMDGNLSASFISGSVTINSGDRSIITASSNVSNLNFYEWRYAYLYDVYVILKEGSTVLDVQKIRTGFRKTQRIGGSLQINDRTIQLNGYAQRSQNEWPAIGNGIPSWMSDFSNKLMVDGNAKLVRWMHVAPSKQDIESCDRIGLFQTVPAGDKEADSSGRWWEQRVELMRDIMIYNRNNPSVLLYETGNANISSDHMWEMLDLKDQWDPHGGRFIGGRDMTWDSLAEWGGDMEGSHTSSTKLTFGTEYMRDEGSRAWWDSYSPPYYHTDSPNWNRNQDSHALEAISRGIAYYNLRPSTGTEVNSGGWNIVFADTNTHHRGDENFRRSGEVDAMRLIKDAWHANRVMWSGLAEKSEKDISILGHWNYPSGTTKDVYVISSASEVELFINGVSQGYGDRSNTFIFMFPNVNYQSGTIHAVGYDTSGVQTCEISKSTVGSASNIRLTVHTGPNGLRATGSDMALVDAEVVDSMDNRCPTANNMIDFSVTGAGEYRGGIGRGTDNCILSPSLPAHCGITRIIIRSTQSAGTIRVNASSSGLLPASVDIISHAVSLSGGLTTELPDDSLPFTLNKAPDDPFPGGPTPTPRPGEIFIISATAGAEEAGNPVTASFDNNDATRWANDGNVSNAWVQYNFGSTRTVDELNIIFYNGNSRTYPIEITVGSTIVFSGDTTTGSSFNLTFPAISANSIRIEMTGNNSDGHGWFSIHEIKIFGFDGSTPVPELLGDVNHSGDVDIMDALLIAQAYVNLNPANYDASLGDVDCSGSVDIVDALLCAQYYVGLIDQFC